MIEEDLIAEVEKHPILYDKSLGGYNKAKLRDFAWGQVQEALGVKATECKESWTLLRNRYTHALRRRYRKCDSGRQFPKWTFEDEMAFLLPHTEIGQGLTSVEFLDPSAEYQENKYEVAEGGDLIRSVEEEGLASPKPEPESPTHSRPKHKSKKRRREIHAQEILKSLKDSREKEKRLTALDLDEVELFYLSMARTVKQLPPLEQAKIRMEVCRLVGEAEIRQLELYQIDDFPATTDTA